VQSEDDLILDDQYPRLARRQSRPPIGGVRRQTSRKDLMKGLGIGRRVGPAAIEPAVSSSNTAHRVWFRPCALPPDG
jgi:hypothetical protein